MVNIDTRTIQFSKRKADRKFEIIALAEIKDNETDLPQWAEKKWITIDVVPNHKIALERVRELRETL